MVGHRRDQSDSHVPLRSSSDVDCGGSQEYANDGFELKVRPSMTSLSSDDVVAASNSGNSNKGGGGREGEKATLSLSLSPVNGRANGHTRSHGVREGTTTGGGGGGTMNGGVVTISLSDANDYCHDAQNNSITARAIRTGEKCAHSEVIKLLVAFCCLAISAFLNFFLLTIIHDITPKGPPLKDIVFETIGQYDIAWKLGDILSTTNSVIAFSCVLLHHKRLIVLRRLFLLGAILYGLRAIVMGSTFMPPSFNKRESVCLEQLINSNSTRRYVDEVLSRFMTYVVTLGLTSGKDKILCGDLMFSGHTIVLTLMYFSLLQYTPRGLFVLRIIAAPITFSGIAALVISGGHYTMDVLVAYWLASHVFWGYHQVFEMPKEQRAKSPMSRIWWFWLCYWFESDVPEGPLENKWDWPFPYPVSMHRLMDKVNRKLE